MARVIPVTQSWWIPFAHGDEILVCNTFSDSILLKLYMMYNYISSKWMEVEILVTEEVPLLWGKDFSWVFSNPFMLSLHRLIPISSPSSEQCAVMKPFCLIQHEIDSSGYLGSWICLQAWILPYTFSCCCFWHCAAAGTAQGRALHVVSHNKWLYKSHWYHPQGRISALWNFFLGRKSNYCVWTEIQNIKLPVAVTALKKPGRKIRECSFSF